MEDYIARRDFTRCVEQDMTNGIIAEAFQMDEDALKRIRAQSVRNVKATNGLISLEKYARSVRSRTGMMTNGKTDPQEPLYQKHRRSSGYLRYIATRERVELIPDDRPPTRKQEQLIAKLVKDFPDSKTLYEYEDYLTKPTKVSASAFITLALEANWDSIHESEQYMKYIATRPRAERIGTHGLFSDGDSVSLEKHGRVRELHRKCVDAHHLPQA